MSDPSHSTDKTETYSTEPHYFQWGLTAFCVIVASVLVFYLLGWLPFIWIMFKKLIGILGPFIFGFVMAYLLLPIFNGMYRKIQPRLSAKMKNGTRFAKGLCSILTLLIGLAIIGMLLWMVLPQLVASIITLLGSMDTYLNEISNWVAGFFKDNPALERNFLQLYEEFSDQMIGWIQGITPRLVELMSGVKNTVSVLFDFLIGIIISLYILNSKDTFCAQAKKVIYGVMRVDHANRVMSRVSHIHRVFGGFITGKLIDSFIIGVLCFIGVALMKIPYAVLISVIIGVTNIIPFFGPFIGAIPSIILIAVISPVKAVYFGIFIVVLQQFDGNILGPKILGDSTGLSSFWVMFAILVFGGVFGFVGMAVGVPIFAVLYSVATEFFNNLLKKRGLSTDTNAYRGPKRIDPETFQFVETKDNIPPVSKKERRQADKAKEDKKQ